jgi:transposase
VSGRLRVREIDDDEGQQLVRIVRRGSGSVVTWRRAQMVLLSAQGMDVPAIAKVAFTSEDRVCDVIGNFNADGFSSLYPKYKGGHPPKFTLGQRREIKKLAKSKPAEHDLPFSTWSLAKLADFLVAEGVVDDISHEGLRVLLRQEGVTFQRLKTWKASKDPRYAEKKARVEHLYAIADREITPKDGDPEIVFCVDEFGPLNLQPRPGRQWAPVSGKNKEPGRAPWRSWSSGATCAPEHAQGPEGRHLGDGEQRRDRLHADEFFLVKPHRSAVHGVAVLHAGRHRPWQPHRTGQHDPPVHHLAQQPRLRRKAPPHRCQGKRSLVRH